MIKANVASWKGIQDSLEFWIPRCGFRIPYTVSQYLSVKLGFWIPIVNGISDSLNCIPDSKDQDSWNSSSKIFPDFLIQILLHSTPEYPLPLKAFRVVL